MTHPFIYLLFSLAGVQSSFIYGAGTATVETLMSQLADGYEFNRDNIGVYHSSPKEKLCWVWEEELAQPSFIGAVKLN